MDDLVFKAQLEPLVMLARRERWVLRVSKVCQAHKVREDRREMVDQPEKMVFLEMVVRLATLAFLESLVCRELLAQLELVVSKELREMSDLQVLKASKVFQVPKDLSVSLVKRVLQVLLESQVLLDVPELVESVVTLEREDLRENRDLKVRLVHLVPPERRVLLVKLEIRARLEQEELKDFKDCPD